LAENCKVKIALICTKAAIWWRILNDRHSGEDVDFGFFCKFFTKILLNVLTAIDFGCSITFLEADKLKAL